MSYYIIHILWVRAGTDVMYCFSKFLSLRCRPAGLDPQGINYLAVASLKQDFPYSSDTSFGFFVPEKTSFSESLHPLILCFPLLRRNPYRILLFQVFACNCIDYSYFHKLQGIDTQACSNHKLPILSVD